VLGTKSCHRTCTCNGRRKGVNAGWLESNRRRGASRKGEHPALGPVPLPVPPGEVPFASSFGKTDGAQVVVST
jgi:hypothetical protein